MKRNLQEDGLEKFLKKSFENYEDTPSGDLWDKISGDLDAPGGDLGTRPPGKSVPMYKTWWAGAAAALFVGVISAQFLYFQNRIDHLTQEIDNQKVKIEKTEKSKEDSTLKKSENATQSNENLEAEIPAGIVEGKNSKTKTPSENTINSAKTKSSFDRQNEANNSIDLTQNKATAPPTKIPTTPNEPETSLEKSKQVRIADKLSPSDSDGGDLSPLNEAPFIANDEQKAEQNSNDFFDKNLKNEVVETSSTTVATIDFLPLKNSNLTIEKSDFSITNLPTVDIPFKRIEPVRNRRKGISIGATAGFYQTTERLNREFKEDFRPPPPVGFFHVRHQPKTIDAKTWMAGIDLKIDLGNNWSINSGALYRKDDFSFDDVHRIPFKDFRPGQNPRDFETNIFQNTGGGITSALIQVKPRDGVMIPPNDEINVNTKVKRQTKYLSIPLSIGYRIDRGDWHFDLGGGVLANFMMSDSLELSVSSELNDPRFRTGKEIVQQKRKSTPFTNKNYFNGMVNLGIEYDLTEHVSVSLSPSLLFDLTERTKHISPRADADFLSIGLNAGVNYNF